MATASERVYLGIALVAFSVVFLLSGLGVFRVVGESQFIVDERMDVIIAFVALAIGISYVYSEIKS